MKFARRVLTVLSFFIIVTFGATTPSTWAVNRVVSLDGDGDYVEIADSDVLNNVGRQVTMEAWIQADRFANVFMPIIYKGDRRSQAPPGTQLGNRSYTLWLWDREALHFTGAPSAQSQIWINSPNGSIQPMRWYHVAGVVDTQTGVMKIFIDGVEVANGTFAKKEIWTSQLLLRIGWTHEEEIRRYAPFAGQIDEVRIWNIARTQEGIQGTMNTTLSGDEPGLVGYWNFDDDTANDRSKHGNHGTLHGDAQIVEAPMIVIVEDKVVNPGEIFAANISLRRAASALHSFTFDLRFDPAILQVVSIKEGPLLSGDGAAATGWRTPQVDNEKGGVTNVHCERIEADGVEGTGSLAVVMFKAIKAGNSDIHVENLGFFSPNGKQIPTQTQVGWVGVFPNGSISGVVRDAENQTPVKGITIEVSNKWSRLRRQVYSDPEGVYTISHVPVGNATVRAKKRGFSTVTKKVFVKPGEETSNVDFQMRRVPKLVNGQ